MRRIRTILSRPGGLLITLVLASDLAYRLLLRPTVRRGLGIQDLRPPR
jgi:hypothetical protein